jgi:hypothetical protein
LLDVSVVDLSMCNVERMADMKHARNAIEDDR